MSDLNKPLPRVSDDGDIGVSTFARGDIAPSRDYDDLMDHQNHGDPTGPTVLEPIEEHYLKRELLDLQIQQEIIRFNNFDALERFGSPFQTKSEKHLQQSDPPETKLHTIERRNSFSVNVTLDQRLLNDPYYLNGFSAEFPILRFIFTKYVVTFPFLTAIPLAPFFQTKLQPVLESFASKQISSTEDRREETKRHKMMRKLSKGVVIYLAAGLDTTSGQRERDEKVQISKMAEDFANKPEIVKKVKTDHKFINGIKINICGVRRVKVKSGAFGLFSEVHHEFLIESAMENEDASKKDIVARRYTDFKDLDKRLHDKFPGKQIPRLPGKNKQTSEINFDGANLFNNGDDLDDDNYDEEYKTSHGTVILVREKQRMALRHYLHSLCEIGPIARSPLLWEFLFKDHLTTLTREEVHDIDLRRKMDLKRIHDQTKFYKIAVQRAKEVEIYMNEFKSEIVKKDGLLRIFNEVKDNTSIQGLSPMFQNFLTWAKVEISATLYSLFIGSDNSQEFFMQIKKLHRFFPYMLVKNILRYSNPVAIMKAFLDLFLAQPFGKRSLLQNIFWVILGDDIKAQERQIVEVEGVIKKFADNNRLYEANTCRGYEAIGTVINQYVFKISEETRLKIREKCVSERIAGEEIDADLVYTIFVNLGSVFEGADLSSTEKNHIKLAGMIVKNLYLELERKHPPVSSNRAVHDTAASPKEQYEMIKKLLLLNIRKRDKNQLQQLWLEPRLGKLIQEIMTIFYGPLIKIFKEGDLHIAIGHFEKFMNDLIKLVERYDDGGASTSTDQLVDEFNNLLMRHEDNFFLFIHNIYVKDKEGLFDNIMRWMGDILQWIQHSPDKAKIDLQRVVLDGVNSEVVELSQVKSELDAIIKWKLAVKEWHERHLIALNNNNSFIDSSELDWQEAVPLAGLSGKDFGFDDNDFIELEAEHLSDDDYEDEDDHIDGGINSVKSKAKKVRTEPPPPKPELVAVPKLLFLFNKELSDKLES